MASLKTKPVSVTYTFHAKLLPKLNFETIREAYNSVTKNFLQSNSLNFMSAFVQIDLTEKKQRMQKICVSQENLPGANIYVQDDMRKSSFCFQINVYLLYFSFLLV